MVSDSKLAGTLEHIVFRSEETGFVVGRVKSSEQQRPVTVAGQLAGANVGEYLLLKGSWEIHPEYGQQFKVKSYQAEQPVTREGIIKFLGSGLIKGIGPKTAESIVKQWGEETLEIIEKEPQRLTEVEGIGNHKSELIRSGWQEQKSIKNLMLFLHKFGVTTNIAHKLHKNFGEQAYRIIKSNPYKLQEIHGIGFHTADKIAVKLGLNLKSPQRMEAAIVHLLNESAQDGHCYLKIKELLNGCQKLTAQKSGDGPNRVIPDEEDIHRQLIAMAEKKSVIITSLDISQPQQLNEFHDNLPELSNTFKNTQINDKIAGLAGNAVQSQITNDNLIVYLPPFYFAEINSAKRMVDLFLCPSKALGCFDKVDWGKAFKWLASLGEKSPKRSHFARRPEAEHRDDAGGWAEHRDDVREAVLPLLSAEQKEAIVKGLTNKVSIITGGPGTGKSTITAAIVALARAKKMHVQLAAPTGRAAKRMTEITGLNAQTIHRMLEFSWQKDGLQFKRNQNNPLEGNLLIIDEVSMLSILLFNHLAKALKPDSSIIFIGDVDQLPSIGAGNVLQDLIDCGVFPVSRLTRIFRQFQHSYIVTNAHRIKSGLMPVFPQNKLGNERSSNLTKRTYTEEKTASTSQEEHTGNELTEQAIINGHSQGKKFLPANKTRKEGFQESSRSNRLNTDFFFFGAATHQKAQQLVLQLVTEKLPRKFGFSPLNDIQVLAPMHKGHVGISELNRALQEKLNPFRNDDQEIRFGSKILRKNDRIIQLQNNYEKEVFNGDFGFIDNINKELQTVTVDFENPVANQKAKKVTYDISDLDQITHAYAITIHKSQGSEFPVVVIPLTTQHFVMLQRNLLYTSVTRAKRMVVIVGTSTSIELALKNTRSMVRNTRLAGLIKLKVYASC